MDLIKTDRLILRRLMAQDAAPIAALLGDIDVSRWLTRVPHPYGLSDAQEFIEHPSAANDLVFGITNDSTLMGCVTIKEELGYWLGVPFWGHGFGSEAVHALVSHYFSVSDRTLMSGHMLKNEASQAILRKLGFEDSRVEPAHCLALKQYMQIQKMQLSKARREARS